MYYAEEFYGVQVATPQESCPIVSKLMRRDLKFCPYFAGNAEVFGHRAICLAAYASCEKSNEAAPYAEVHSYCYAHKKPVRNPGDSILIRLDDSETQCYCPRAEYEPYLDTAFCVPSALTISLSGANQVRPLSTGGNSTALLIAKVTDGTNPKADISVRIEIEAVERSGGHDHHSDRRPLGSVTPIDGTTDANGEVKFVYQASAFAGIHKISASCGNCKSANGPNTAATAEIEVKVPDLVKFAADTRSSPSHTLRGADAKHASNHWFSARAVDNLKEIIKALNSLGWKPVGINDASLKWGGSFDIDGNWVVGRKHAEHRLGEEVDISFGVGTTPVIIKDSYDLFCRDKKVDIPSTMLWHDIPLNQGGAYPPHFHVRLDGKYTVSPNIGKSVLCSRDSETMKK